MVNIVGKYQHERDENVDEFLQILGVAYIDMMGICNSELEITKNNDEWRIETVSAIGVQTSVFTLDTEYEEITPSGVVLKNTTTRAGDSLITIFITNGGNVIIRKYDFTEDAVVLKILLARTGQVAIRYFKRTNVAEPWTPSNIALVGTAAVVGGGLAVAAAPLVVAAAGFTSGGIAGGSMAASMMSVLGGGATSAGGVVATLQSVGALGTVLGSTAATAAAAGTGAVAGAAAGAVVARATRN